MTRVFSTILLFPFLSFFLGCSPSSKINEAEREWLMSLAECRCSALDGCLFGISSGNTPTILFESGYLQIGGGGGTMSRSTPVEPGSLLWQAGKGLDCGDLYLQKCEISLLPHPPSTVFILISREDGYGVMLRLEDDKWLRRVEMD